MSDLTGVDKLFHGAFCALSPQQLALSAFNFSILVGGWKSISYCGLICISLMSNVGSFLRAYWLFVYFLLQNICSGIWLFKIMLGSPLSSVQYCGSLFQIQIVCQLHVLQHCILQSVACFYIFEIVSLDEEYFNLVTFFLPSFFSVFLSCIIFKFLSKKLVPAHVTQIVHL